MTNLGSDWVPGLDGIPRRKAARAVIFSPQGEVLLLRGHDGHNESFQWWFTVGGGIAPGESARECVMRETHEETGLWLTADALIGPVLHREADFLFSNVHARQEEWFFLVFLDERPPIDDHSGRTKTEQNLLDDYRWISPQSMIEIRQTMALFPHSLPELATAWWNGWDGHCATLNEVDASQL